MKQLTTQTKGLTMKTTNPILTSRIGSSYREPNLYHSELKYSGSANWLEEVRTSITFSLPKGNKEMIIEFSEQEFEGIKKQFEEAQKRRDKNMEILDGEDWKESLKNRKTVYVGI